MKHLFLDTNILAHFKSIDEINWSELLGDKDIHLIIHMIVIDELAKIKDDFKNNPGNRARDVFKLLDVLDFSKPVRLKNGALLEICNITQHSRPQEYDLDYSTNDDRIIGSVLKYQSEVESKDVYIVTYDGPLSVRIRYRNIPINIYKMPLSNRLESLNDPLLKEIDKLRKENMELKKPLPALSLVFQDDKAYKNFPVPTSFVDDRDDEMHRIIEMYPLYEEDVETLTMGASLERIIGLGDESDGVISLDERHRYNVQLKGFFAEYADYLDKKRSFQMQELRTIAVNIVVKNDGGMNGEGVDIELIFPENTTVFFEEDRPKLPEPPSPPEKPKSAFKRLLDSSIGRPTYLANFLPSPISIVPFLSRSSEINPYYRIDENHILSVSIGVVKHNYSGFELKQIHVALTTSEDPKSFSIPYTIRADNHSGIFEGELSIIIESKV